VTDGKERAATAHAIAARAEEVSEAHGRGYRQVTAEAVKRLAFTFACDDDARVLFASLVLHERAALEVGEGAAKVCRVCGDTIDRPNLRPGTPESCARCA